MFSGLKKVAVALALVLFLIPSVASAATYYVDATLGNNTNNGTSTTTPWQTLTKVNGTTFSPGDTILFKKGETFAGNIVVGQSGTNGNPITFGAYGEGNRPIINATGNNHGVSISTNKSYIAVQGLDVRNATLNQFLLSANSGSVSHVTISDSVGFGGSNAGINMLGPGTLSDISVSSTTLSGYSGGSAIGIRVGGAGPTVDRITLDGVSASSATGFQGFTTGGSGAYSNISILNSSFTGHTSSGLVFLAATTTNSEIRNTIASSNNASGISFLGSKSGITIQNVTANSNASYGVVFESTGPMGNIRVEDSELNENGINGLSLLGDSAGTSTVIYRTTASHNEYDGFAVTGNWKNVLFDESTADENGVDGIGADGDGFTFHTISTGTIRNSIARNNKKSAVTNVDTSSTTLYNNLFSHDTNGTNAVVTFLGSGSHSVYNNVIYSPAQVGYGLTANETATLVAKNNIIQGFQYGASKGASATFTEDYNDVYGTGTASYQGIVPGTHSISLDPRFIDVTDEDFRLLQSSPAINAGTTTPYATDHLGNARVGVPDMGAYEYQGVPDLTAPSVSITAPSDGATVSGTIDITATATDGVGVEGVQFFLDGQELEDEDESDPYSISWDTTDTSDGSHTLYAVARDAEDNYTTSTSISVMVANAEDNNGGSSGRSGQRRQQPSSTTSVTTASNSVATSSIPSADFTIGATGEGVRVLQLWLITHSYSIPAGATGYFGPQTQAALASYRASLSGVSSTLPNVMFYRALFLGSTGPDVTALQQILKAKGFYLYPEITGYYGQITLQAVADFQRSIGLDHLGYVGPATRAALNALPR